MRGLIVSRGLTPVSEMVSPLWGAYRSPQMRLGVLGDRFVQTSAKPAAAASWRERLWTVPPETRIGAVELCEAIGRTKSWVYRCTGPKAAGPRLPHRLLHGELVFVVGELRQWLLEQEEIVVPGRTAGIVVHQAK